MEKLKSQKRRRSQDKTQYPGRGRGQVPRLAQQTRPPLTPTAPPMPAQQASQPTATRGRGRGGANTVIKRGGRGRGMPYAPITIMADTCETVLINIHDPSI